MAEEAISWVKLFKRESELLIVFQVPVGRSYYPEVLGIEFKPKNIKHEGWFYYADRNDLAQEFAVVKKTYEDNPNFLAHVADNLEKKGRELVDRVSRITADSQKKSPRELQEAFREFNTFFTQYMPYIWVLFPIERLLSENLRQRLKKAYSAPDETIEKYFGILISVPFGESTALKERTMLLQTASLLRKERQITPMIRQMIQQAYDEFSWVGAMRVGWTYLKDPYDLKHYERLIEILAEGNPEKELQEIKERDTEVRENYRDFITKEIVGRDLLETADMVRRYVFLRTLRGEFVVKAMAYARPLLAEIASRFNLRLEDIVYFTPDEITDLIESGRIPDYNSRKIGYKLLILDGKPSVVGGITVAETNYEVLSEVRGEGIVEGLVRGRVKILARKEDVRDFAKGQILVAQMTSPDMMPAMVKACAIITDEGGLTCHAALISRELKIPCIIATEIATKVFKDGTMVEVDSKHGVVRKVA